MKAYLFDVDGVLSDPTHKVVTEPELFEEIIKKLQQGNPVCLNTGRSTSWLVERVVNPLNDKIRDKSMLHKLSVIGEKGFTWITFDESGKLQHGKRDNIGIPQEIIDKTKNLVKDKYSDAMFFDDTKETMMSIEMHDGFDIDQFHKRREEFLKDLKQILADEQLKDMYKIDPSNISTDVESVEAGKNLGAAKLLNFLKEINCEPTEFDTFGDSESDFGMSDELEKRGKSVKMIYVGDRNKLGDIQRNYPIEYVEGFTQGTLEYLKKD